MNEPCPHPWPSAEPAQAVPRPSEPVFEIITYSGDEWDDSLPLEVAPAPALLPVGCNAYFGSTQWVWLRIDWPWDGLERADDDWIGRRRDWYDRVLDEAGWDAVLDPHRTRGDTSWVDFMLREGIAPGQPFLVEVYYKSWRDGFGEWDEDWDVAVVARAPVSGADALAAWEVVALEVGGWRWS